MDAIDLTAKLAAGLMERSDLLGRPYHAALRLFNGFTEGCPDLAVDIYAQTLVLFNYAECPFDLESSLLSAQAFYLNNLPWLQAVLVKTRHGPDAAARAGRLTYGEKLDCKVGENNIWYSLDLQLHQDASFYIDTRSLRAWLKTNMDGKRVLNTFAYTGSLGAAALAGGAIQVLQTDRTARFLDLARQTYRLNGWLVDERDFVIGDFYRVCAERKRRGELFDCLILDPPIFSSGRRARVDVFADYSHLINKIRPMVAHQGWIVAVNNGLFVSGAEYLAMLEHLCAGGFLEIETLLPVPQDACGYERTRVIRPPVDPAPFNHSTKIVVLRVRRKDGRKA